MAAQDPKERRAHSMLCARCSWAGCQLPWLPPAKQATFPLPTQWRASARTRRGACQQRARKPFLSLSACCSPAGGALVGKPVAAFCSVATQGGGMET